MTYQEALQRIQDHNRIHSHKEPRAVYITEALFMATAAIEKQIPIQLICLRQEKQGQGYYLETKKYHCFSCGNVLFSQRHEEKKSPECDSYDTSCMGSKTKYCCYCGQALDWSDI